VPTKAKTVGILASHRFPSIITLEKAVTKRPGMMWQWHTPAHLTNRKISTTVTKGIGAN